ncbi:MAG TPA: hypothetical protein VNG33_00860 [Polyangiaceae bacterium]|nr:hypothetical protein [Polyangiaceae bacterium]
MRSQTGRGAFAWAVLTPTLALAEPAASAPAGALGLRWSDAGALAPTTARELASRLSERLGYPAFDDAATDHALAVSWQGSAEQCAVELQLVRGPEIEGTRRIESPTGDCRALIPALLTVAALLIESQQTEPPPAAPEPSPPAPPARSSAPEPTPEAYPSAEKAAPVLLSLGAELGSGLAPKLELGPAAAVTFAPIRYVRIGAEAALFFPHQYAAAPGFSLSHEAGRLLACGMPVTGAFGLGLCGSAALHRFTSSGISLPHPETHHSLAWTGGLALRAEWRLQRHLWWVGSIGADVTARPLYFYYTPAPGGETILFRQERVAPSLLLGLTLELP